MAKDYGCNPEFFNAIEKINARQKGILVEKLLKYFNGDLKGKTIALWGLAFKPKTDDMREAPSHNILDLLWKNGVKVQAYDPVAMNEARRIYGSKDNLIFCETAEKALANADALMVITEWDEFKNPDFELIKNKLKNKVVFDGRNIYSPEKMLSLGIEYHCIGRSQCV